MGNFVNWISGGDWAPTSNAAAEEAARQSNIQLENLKQQQKQLESEEKAQREANQAKQIQRLRSLGSGSGLTAPTDKSSLLG